MSNNMELMEQFLQAQNAEVMYTSIDSSEDNLQVDWDAREIRIPPTVTNAGVIKDHLSKKLVLEMDRYVNGHDITGHTFAIHFVNVKKWEGPDKKYPDVSSGVYPVTSIDTSVAGKVICEWDITNASTQIAGVLGFSLHVFTIVDGSFTYHLGVQPAVLDMLDTINATEHGKNVMPTELEVWLQKMANINAEIDSKIARAEAAAVRAEQAAANFEVDATLSMPGRAADAKATGDRLRQLSSEIVNGSGLTDEAKTALLTCFKNVAWTVSNGQDYYNALETALNASGSSGGDDSGDTEKTLTSISVTYTGGDVYVGSLLTDLSGITVTANYSDGSTANVTGYTLSGTIAEGQNTITVTYNELTKTFVVIGIAESGGEVVDISSFVIYNDLFGDKGIYNDKGWESQIVDLSAKANAAIVAASDYYKSNTYDVIKRYIETDDYQTMYAVFYFPHRNDQYGVLSDWKVVGIIGNETYQFTEIGFVPSAHKRGETEDYKLYYAKLEKNDVLDLLIEKGYAVDVLRQISCSAYEVGQKNYDVKVVWMATEPTEKQCLAIRDFFANGGEL